MVCAILLSAGDLHAAPNRANAVANLPIGGLACGIA
jgi:hypothetical protein